MNNPTEQPDPVVTEKHKSAFAIAIYDAETAFDSAILNDKSTDEARLLAFEDGEKAIARAFPIQVPTTDMPTEPGNYWYRYKLDKTWNIGRAYHGEGLLWFAMLSDEVEASKLQDGYEYLRIPTPDDLAGKEQA